LTIIKLELLISEVSKDAQFREPLHIWCNETLEHNIRLFCTYTYVSLCLVLEKTPYNIALGLYNII